MRRALLVILLLASAAPAAEPSAEQVFEKRIKPIFASPNPSSCVQCHLAGVDLKNYIRPSATETFLSLRDQGLVDLDKPEKSRILDLIAMGKDDKGAKLIHQKARTAEYEAFAAWIAASAADPALRNAPKLDAGKFAKPARPNEVIRHERMDRLLASFESNVWSMRFRCMSCHNEGTAENKKLVGEFGPRVAWFKSAGPEATMQYLIESKLIDVADPAKSLLLQKPLNAVKHEGGQKFLPGDQGYKAFRTFLDDFAKIKADSYATAVDLPKESKVDAFGTESWLKIVNTPPAWGDKLLTVKLFAWDAKANKWETEPIATSDRKVSGTGKLWQHTLTILAPAQSERATAWKAGPAALPPGKYRVQVYVDFKDRQSKDWTAEPGPAEYAGHAEIDSKWTTGYGKMTVVDAGLVKKK